MRQDTADKRNPMQSLRKRGAVGVVAITFLGIVAIIMLGMFIYVWVYVQGEPGDPDAEGSVQITIPQGAGAWRVARDLKDAGLIESPRRFVYHLRFRKDTEDLRFGVYEIQRSASMAKIADMLTSGRVMTVKVTIPEGWTSRQIAQCLQKKDICDSAAFMEAVNSAELANELDLPGETLEGFLFPETYNFPYGLTGEDVARIMVETFKDMTGEGWWEKAEQSRLGVHGVVILASLVQGEVQLPEEAGDVAAVYSNRLKRGMLLQADPTIQYLLPEPRRLLNRHLEVDSPYNTYKYKGLPPGPINNPGLVALRAAADPPEKPWIYMVATGDGGHTFTTNLRDHNKAKARFDEVRRRLAREERRQRNAQ